MIHPRSRYLSLSGLLAFLLAVIACRETDQPGLPETGSDTEMQLTLAYPADSATVFALMYARQKGIFRQEGLRVEMHRIRGIPQIVAILMSGDIDVAWFGFDGMTNAIVEGVQELRYIGEFLKEVPQSLLVAPHIQSIVDLRGQPVATAGSGTLTDTLFTEGLRRGGLADPKRDTLYLNLSGAENRLTQLLTGTVVAASLKVPFAQLAQEKGFRILQYQGNLLEPWSGQGLITHTRVISSKREALRRLVKSVARAVREMGAQKEAAVAVAVDYLALDPAMAEQVYQNMMAIYRPDGRWNVNGIQRAIDARSRPGQKIDARRFLDESFLEENSSALPGTIGEPHQRR